VAGKYNLAGKYNFTIPDMCLNLKELKVIYGASIYSMPSMLVLPVAKFGMLSVHWKWRNWKNFKTPNHLVFIYCSIGE